MKKTFAIFFLLSVFTLNVSAQGTAGNPGNTGGTVGNPGETGGTVGNDRPAYCSSITEKDKGFVVPCGTKYHICYDEVNAECGFRHLFILVNNMAKHFITIVFAPLLTIMLMYIGFLFIKDQAGALVKAKALLLRLLIGTFFVLGAWLIVNFILNVFNVDTEIKKPLQGDNTN